MGGKTSQTPMKITQADKDKVIALLTANPKATTHPMFHWEIVTKTGLTSPKVTAIRKELLEEGRIREQHASGFPIAVYLMVTDKRQQILDLALQDTVRYVKEFQVYVGLPEQQVYQLCIQLVAEGLLDVAAMLVIPSPKLIGMTPS